MLSLGFLCAVTVVCSAGQMDTGDLYNLAVKRLLDLKTYHLARVWNAAVYTVNIVEEGSVRGHGDVPCACVCVCEYNPLHMHSNPGHGTVLIEDQEMHCSCHGIFLRSFSQLLVWSSVSGGLCDSVCCILSQWAQVRVVGAGGLLCPSVGS